MPSASNTASFGKMFQATQLTNSILDKVAQISEANSEQMASVVTNIGTTTTTLGRIEKLLSLQNKILFGIAFQLRRQSGQSRGQAAMGAGGGFGFRNLQGFGKIAGVGAGVAATMVALTGAVVASAVLLNFIPSMDPTTALAKFGIALGTVGVILLMAGPFALIAKTLSGFKNSKTASLSSGASITTGSTDIMGMVAAVGATALAIAGMAISIVAASWIFYLLPSDPGLIVKLGIAALVGLALIPISISFGMVLKILSSMKSSTSIGVDGLGGSKSGSDTTGMLLSTGLSLAVIPLLALSLVGASWAFMLMPSGLNPMTILTAGLVALALIPMAYAFSAILKAIGPLAMNPVALAIAVGAAVIAFPLIAMSVALAIRGMGLILTSSDQYPELPAWDWIGRFSIMMIISAATFYLVSKAVKGLGIMEVIYAGLAIPIMIGGFALAMKAWDWLAPDDPSNKPFPGLLEVITIGAAVAILAIPAFILGKIGLKGVAVGALGIVAMMGALGAGLWAFDKLAPDDPAAIAAKMSEAVMQPFYAIVDFIDYFNKKIPVGMAGDIAWGLTQIGLGFAAFAASVTVGGVAKGVGSVVEAAAGVFEAGFDWIAAKVRGTEVGEARKDPLQILTDLANMAPQIQMLGGSLFTVADAFSKIGAIAQPSLLTAAGFMTTMNSAADKYVAYAMLATSSTTIAQAYERIARASNDINIEGINATKEMFQALDNLAKAGGSDAIDSMKELLVETLEALAEAVHTMTTDNTTLSEALGNTITAVTNAVGLTEPKATEGEATSDQSPLLQSNRQLLKAIQLLKDRLDGNLFVEVQNINQLRD